MADTNGFSKVSDQRTFINTHPEPKPPTSSLYMQRRSTKNGDGTEEHQIVGVHIIFKSGNSNGLYKAFHVPRKQKINASDPKVAVKSLLIACDTLEIHGELSLPECDVSIYARKLVFKSKGFINTTPLQWDLPKAPNANPVKRTPGQDGAHGRNGGDLIVMVDEVIISEGEKLNRFFSEGGRGQSAGLGKRGNNGTSMPSYKSRKFTLNDSGIKKTYCNAKFNPPAVYIDYEWRWAASRIGSGNIGANRWPTSGQDALAPGVPGNGGDGGRFTTNRKQLVALLENKGNMAGDKANSVTGGVAGLPLKCSHYKLTLWHNWIKKYGSIDYKNTGTKTTKRGKNFNAKAPKKAKGITPKTTIVDIPNAWLHPFQLRCVLSFMRDSFLAGEHEILLELLLAYDHALGETKPTDFQPGVVWNDTNAVQWVSAQTEVATQLQRLQSHLDYFGNPAGYMPLLSLQGNMRLYDIESSTALRTLLLASWVSDRKNRVQSANKAFGHAIKALNEDTQRVASYVAEAEGKVTDVSKRIDALQNNLQNMGVKLETLKNRLLTKAKQDLHLKAQIKFGIKMASAICQVIPVAQPVLGTVGNLASIAAEFDENGTADTVSKIGEALDSARNATRKSNDTTKQAKNEKRSEAAIGEVGAKRKASIWAKVGDGLGPALSQVGNAISTLQVSQGEINAELERLKAESHEWNEMVGEIIQLNDEKREFFTDLMDALQTIGDGYRSLSSNAGTVVTMQQQRNDTLAKLDLEATLAVAELGQRARFALQRALYLMVKSFETSVFKPIIVNWQMTKIFKKINVLLKPDEGFDANTMKTSVDVLDPIFKNNLEQIKKQLLDQYGFNRETSMTLEFGLTEQQTKQELIMLHTNGRIIFDPVEYGLILPQRQRVRLEKVQLASLEFSETGITLPASGNMIISLKVGDNGTVRSSESLYVVRSDAPRVWSWTYHFSDKSMNASEPSTSSLDLLNALLQSSDKEIKQKLASPPSWSDIELSISFTPPLPKTKRPRLSKLMFKAISDSLPAPDTQRVLDVRSVGACALMECSPGDLANRSSGYGNLYRIYPPRAKVKLQAPGVIGRMNFSHWEIIDEESMRTLHNEKITLQMGSNTLIYCHFKADNEAETMVTHNLSERRMISIAAKDPKVRSREEAMRVLKETSIRSHSALKTELCGPERLIRKGAGIKENVIGVIPEGALPTEMGVARKGWQKVQYRGVIGYRNVKRG